MAALKKGLVAGAFSLALAGLISRILGVIYIVPLQNMAKDYAMGLYQMAYSIYVVILMIATAGIPLAMSKLISERNALHDFAGADQIYRVGARYLLGTGLVFFLLMMLTAPWVARLMGDEGATAAIRALSFAVLIVPWLAAMRGYLQGHQAMAVSGNSQVIEQLVRVVLILLGVFIAVSIGTESRRIAAIATLGAALGAVAAFFYIAGHLVRTRRQNKTRIRKASQIPDRQVFRTILKVAVPITLTSLIFPLSQLIDSLTITNLLMSGFGWSIEQATAEFGIFTARALRLIALPLSVAVAIGFSLMPAVSEAIAQGNTAVRNQHVLTSLRLTSLFAFPAAIGIGVLAGPLDIALFTDLQGADTIALVSLMAIFASFEVVCAYLLQSLGHMYLPIRYMGAGLVLKLVLNILFVPSYGILGAAGASVLGYLLSAVLSLYGVKKVTGVRLPMIQMFAKPLLASLLMGGVVWAWTQVPLDTLLPWPRLANLLIVMVGAGIGAVVFGGLLFLLKAITRDELRHLPVIKRFVG